MLLTVHETAERLRVARGTVYAMRRRGEIPGYQIGGKLLFKSEELDAYIESRLVRGTDPMPKPRPAKSGRMAGIVVAMKEGAP